MDDDTRQRDRLIALFFFGVLSFSPLVMRLVGDQPAFVSGGIPVIYLYAFGVWLVLIGLMALAVEVSRDSGDGAPPPMDREKE